MCQFPQDGYIYIYILQHIYVYHPIIIVNMKKKTLFDRITTGTIQLSNRVKLYTNCF